MAKLRISEAQVLYEALQDPVLRLTLQVFCNEQHDQLVADLLHHLKLKERDMMKEAQLAGQLDAYDNVLSHLDDYAKRALRESNQ